MFACMAEFEFPYESCVPGERIACYSGPSGTSGVGACRAGTSTCVMDGSGWGPCAGEVVPLGYDDCVTGADATCDGQAAEPCTGEIAWVVRLDEGGDDEGTKVAGGKSGVVYVAGHHINNIDGFGPESCPAADTNDELLVGALRADDGATVWGSCTDPQGLGDETRVWSVDETSDGTVLLSVRSGDRPFLLTFDGATGESGRIDIDASFPAHILVDVPIWAPIFIALSQTDDVRIGQTVVEADGPRLTLGTLDPSAGFDAAGVFDLTAGPTSETYLVSLATGEGGEVALATCFTDTALDLGCGTIEQSTNWRTVVAMMRWRSGELACRWQVLLENAGSAAASVCGTHVAVDGSGGVALAATAEADMTLGATALPADPLAPTSRDVVYARLDADGRIVFANRYGGASPQYPTAIALDAFGNAVLVGAFQGSLGLGQLSLPAGDPNNDWGVFVAKLAPDGALAWARGFGQEGDWPTIDVDVDPVGAVLVSTGFDGQAVTVVPPAGQFPLDTNGKDAVFMRLAP
jgi:hypothetical protein